MSYRRLYQLPCRLPCQRYASVDTVFEAEQYDDGAYEPTVSRESYEYEPTVSGEGFQPDVDPEAKCDCGPLHRPYRMQACGYNQSPTTMAQPQATLENYEYEPTVSGEGFSADANDGEANCECGPRNRPYRMQACGYNQSPTWIDQAQFRDTTQNRM